MPRPKKTDSTQTAAAKTTASKTVKKAAPAAETAPKKTTRVRKTVSVTLQFAGKEWATDVLTTRAIVAWSAEHSKPKTAAKEIQLYVKPEEEMVYYVINGDSGSFSI